LELEALQTVLPQLEALDASVVAISPQLAQYGQAVRRRAKLQFDVPHRLHLLKKEARRRGKAARA